MERFTVDRLPLGSRFANGLHASRGADVHHVERCPLGGGQAYDTAEGEIF